jgi:long-chain acyl-CoA synthetase
MDIKGLQKNLANKDRAPASFLHWLEVNNNRFPDKVFIHSLEQNRAITYGEMHDLARRIGRDLHARGIGLNDRVALLSNNSLEHLAVYIATLAYGATICTIHVEMNAAYFESILNATNAKLVLYEEGLGLEKLAGKVPGDWQPLGSLNPGNNSGYFAEIDQQPDGDWVTRSHDRDHIASIFYTSGTSSTPKGVVCSYGELYDNTEPTADAFGLTEDDRMLDFRSFNWMSAQVLSVLGPLCKGATLLLAKRFSQSRFFDWVRDHKATISAGNPTVINMLINRPSDIRAADIPDFRFITSSSAPLMVEDWRRFEELYGIRICQGYGSSETGWIAGSHENSRRMGAVGHTLPYQQVRIVDKDGESLPDGDIGLIELGPGPDAEYRYLAEDGSIQIYAKGRTQTGDMGFYDPEGFLTVTGREKDLIIRGGVNIAPVEIDNIVLEMPEVAEVATVGVPDRIYGEEVVVYITAKPGADIDDVKVIDHCRGRLPDIKLPKQVIFQDSLPKTERGKMDRNALADAWKGAAR